MLGAFLFFFWGAGLGKQGCLAGRAAPWSTRSAFICSMPATASRSFFSIAPLDSPDLPCNRSMQSSYVFTVALWGFPSCLPTVQTGSQDRQPYAGNGCPAWQGENKLLMLHKTKMQRNSHGFVKDFTSTALSAAHPDSYSQALQQQLASLGYLSCSMQSTLAATICNTSSTRYS